MNPRLRDAMMTLTWLKSVGTGPVANDNESPGDAATQVYLKAAELMQPQMPHPLPRGS